MRAAVVLCAPRHYRLLQSFVGLHVVGHVCAGTGRSFVLRRIQDALRREGRTTRVAAPQRQQVVDLGRDGLHDAQTVAELLQRRALPEGAVLIVDEAGQISGRQMLTSSASCRKRKAAFILSGDTRQHGPVEASDARKDARKRFGVHLQDAAAWAGRSIRRAAGD